jgi:Tol biopolymer transport system component
MLSMGARLAATTLLALTAGGGLITGASGESSKSLRERPILFTRVELVAEGHDEVKCETVDSVRADSSGLRRLTTCGTGSQWSSSPSWSPDGRRIAFARCPGEGLPGCYEIYVMRADGTHLRRLTHNAVYDDHPSWSPDGKHIVFTRGPREGPEPAFAADVWSMNADGTHAHKLVGGPGLEANPVWSPAGGLIAFFESPKPGREFIALVRPDGTGRHLIARMAAPGGNIEEQLRYARPSWSPDGRKITYLSRSGALTVITLAGRRVRAFPATSLGHFPLHPAWAPNGKAIVFASYDGPWKSLYVFSVNDASVRRLTTPPTLFDDEEPSW